MCVHLSNSYRQHHIYFSIPTLSTSNFVNSHFVNIDQMGIDKVGIDVGIDKVGIDKVGIDKVGIDKVGIDVGRYHLTGHVFYPSPIFPKLVPCEIHRGRPGFWQLF